MREAKTRMTFEHFTLNDTFDRLFISIIGDVMIRPEFRGNVDFYCRSRNRNKLSLF